MCPPMWSESRTSITAIAVGRPPGGEVEDGVAGVSEVVVGLVSAWEVRMRCARSSRDMNVRSEIERVDILAVRCIKAGWMNEGGLRIVVKQGRER